MFVGRFWMIIPAMAIAGSLAAKKTVPASAGTFPTTGGLFVGLLVGVILIVGGLTFFPALALGPHRRASGDDRRHAVLSESHFGVTSNGNLHAAQADARIGPARPEDRRGRRSARPSPSSIRGR